MIVINLIFLKLLTFYRGIFVSHYLLLFSYSDTSVKILFLDLSAIMVIIFLYFRSLEHSFLSLLIKDIKILFS